MAKVHPFELEIPTKPGVSDELVEQPKSPRQTVPEVPHHLNTWEVQVRGLPRNQIPGQRHEAVELLQDFVQPHLLEPVGALADKVHGLEALVVPKSVVILVAKCGQDGHLNIPVTPDVGPATEESMQTERAILPQSCTTKVRMSCDHHVM